MSISIKYTEHGVPHITGDSYFELGKGAGYATAEQNLGLVADRWLTLRGERSRFYGPDAVFDNGLSPDITNLESDLFWRYLAESGTYEQIVNATAPLGPTEDVHELFAGFADGYNAFLEHAQQHGMDDPRFNPDTWLLSISVDDVYRQALHWNLLRSSVAMIPHIVAATAGTGTQHAVPSGPPGYCPDLPDESNMIALGAEVTEAGRGMLYANPHWFWNGADSFREMHLSIPGVLDVYGSVTPGLPLIMSGFSNEIAFAGTSSYSPRFAVYRLELDPEDPTAYLYEGTSRKMITQTVRCPVTTDGRTEWTERTFYRTHHGLLLGGEKYPWDSRHAYCMREVGFSVRWVNQQLDVMRASTAREAEERSRGYLGVGWRNLAVADRDGNVVYADRTAIPNISDEQLARALQRNGSPETGNDGDVVILDGSKGEDEWGVDEDAPIAGIIGVSRLPMLCRRDYVANENDTHWTNHATERLEGFPKIVGPERIQRTLRTRSGLSMIDNMLKRRNNSVSLRDLRAATTEDRVLSAVLWKGEVCAALAETGDKPLMDAAQVLRDWDSCEKIDSKGAILWRRFFHHFAGSAKLVPEQCFATPFKVEDPLNTPAGIDPTAGIGAVEAMRRAIEDMRGLDLDICVGDAQYVEKNGRRYPVPGGPQQTGQYNAIESKAGWVAGHGYPNVNLGTGYQLWVAFTEDGPIGESILAYSQSDNPASEFHTDQTQLFSAGKTKPVRFTRDDIAQFCQREIIL